jgi:hypothetical protein
LTAWSCSSRTNSVALEAGQGLAQEQIFRGQADPESAPAELVRGKMAGEQPVGQLVADVDEDAADGADQDDDGAGKLQAENKENQDEPDDRERAAAEDGEQGPQPVGGPG